MAFVEDTSVPKEPQTKLYLDTTIQDPRARRDLVEKIIATAPPEKLTPAYCEILANYIIFAMDKEEKKQKKIVTDNRKITIDKREMSFQGLVTKFENGEDGIYALIANDKNIIFSPKVQITEEDIEKVPGLKELRERIAIIEEQEKKAYGRKKSLLMKQLIQMRKDQYVLKNSYYRPIFFMNAVKSSYKIVFDDNSYVDENDEIVIKGSFSFMRPENISALLCNYSKVKEDAYGRFGSDSYYMIIDLENLIEKTLPIKYPLLYDLMIYKIDGKTNQQIQVLLEQSHGVKHSVEYISSLWRNKIPKLLAEEAKKDFLIWWFTVKEKGHWKKCSRCGQIKLGHNMFFSKNNTSKDGLYSICKDCRNAKQKKKRKEET